LALAWNWSVVQIGEVKSQKSGQWEIRNKEFRENLEWAVMVPGDREISPGVAELLAELEGRGVEIHQCLGSSTKRKPRRKTDVWGTRR
jgi:beta-phosphoglucomutase-like phosphatase (HAD superfamily)